MKTAKWTSKDIPDLTGKIVIITGANSGLGFESCKELAANGAEVIMACRNTDKGEKAKNSILRDFPESAIHVWKLDLMNLESIHGFAKEFKSKYNKLDILLNNAGIMMPPYGLTKDGFETQFGTNHLGHFALTGLLLDSIKATENARVVTVSSIAHKRGTIDFENLMYNNGEGYSPSKAYGRSKIANLFFTYELQRYFEKNKINASSIAAHPGVAKTNLANTMLNKWLMNILFVLLGWMTQSASKGALPQLMAATKKDAKGGEFYGPTGFNEMKGNPGLVSSVPFTHDEKTAQKLWIESERLTGVKFN